MSLSALDYGADQATNLKTPRLSCANHQFVPNFHQNLAKQLNKQTAFDKAKESHQHLENQS